jgi:hypothetical protein
MSSQHLMEGKLVSKILIGNGPGGGGGGGHPGQDINLVGSNFVIGEKFSG